MSLATQIRADFPFFAKNPDYVYLDSSCMSIRPYPVLEAMQAYYEDMSGCAGRSNHRLARAVTEAVDAAREKVRSFVGARRAEEIIFTRNTTEGINLIAHSLGLKSGDVVVISDKEHNSNLVPWLSLAQTIGIKLRIMKTGIANEYVPMQLDKLLDEKVRLVSMVHTSNLDGTTLPIKDIGKKVHQAGALLMVDGAQSVPHRKIDVKKLGCDFLAFSGHKMMGPTGTGVLYGRYDLLEKLSGFIVGGDTVTHTSYDAYYLLPPPEKFEGGLQDYAGIIGLGAAIEYIQQIGLDKIQEHERLMNQLLTQSLELEERVQLIGPQKATARAGIYSFYTDGIDPHQIALMLDQAEKIMVRSGQHCVHSWFNDRKLVGSVRVSMYAYTTEEEILRFSAALKKIIAVL